MLKTNIENLLRKVNTWNGDTVERNIQIVQTYFGMGSQHFPTLESVAEEFDVGSRERIRQIVTDQFVNKINPNDFIISHKISQIIEEKDVSFVDEVIQQLVHMNVINGEVKIKGLLNLLKVFGFCLDYELYNVEINKATKKEIENKEKLLLIKKEEAGVLKRNMRRIRKFPGRHGMVNFDDVISRNNWITDEEIPLYQSLIKNSKTSKVFVEAGQNSMWYMFEDRDNVIINAFEKLVNVTNQVKTDILAAVIHSYIIKRSFEKNVPTVAIIEQYITNSKWTEINGEFAKVTVEKSNLLEIETDIFNYFKNENKYTVTYPEINSFLEKKGHSEPHRKKALYHCPFIYVDKSKGRGSYQLQLISQFSPQMLLSQEETPYEKYKSLLQKLEGSTDTTGNTKLRKEQSILRDWLFKNKEAEKCAICGRTFAVRSLVAAHKKKRASCTEEERTDPNIVMPVCLLGCDYLYEEGYIHINSGLIHIQKTDALQAVEREYLQVFNGRAVDKRWLQGSDTYFKIS